MSRLGRYTAICALGAALTVTHADARPGAERTPLNSDPNSGSFAIALSAGLDTLAQLFDPLGLLPRLDLSAHRILQHPPVRAPESSGFGWRFHPILKRQKIHKGLDFRADLGTPVLAAAAGKVVFSGSKGTYGLLVIIDHGDGVETRYAHLHRLHVKRGDFVAAGARIARVGATGRVTGAHLHFEVRIRDHAVDPKLCYRSPPND